MTTAEMLINGNNAGQWPFPAPVALHGADRPRRRDHGVTLDSLPNQQQIDMALSFIDLFNHIELDLPE